MMNRYIWVPGRLPPRLAPGWMMRVVLQLLLSLINWTTYVVYSLFTVYLITVISNSIQRLLKLTLLTLNPFYLLLLFLPSSSIGTPDLTGSGAQTNHNNNNISSTNKQKQDSANRLNFLFDLYACHQPTSKLPFERKRQHSTSSRDSSISRNPADRFTPSATPPIAPSSSRGPGL
jgi:hypothetical protein